MNIHAFNILEDAEFWDWHETRRVKENGNKGAKYKIPTAQLLYHLIKQSTALGGTVLEQFWDQLRKCHPKLWENIQKLQVTGAPIPPGQTSAVLFAGIDRKDVNLDPIFEMAAGYFSHLCVAMMSPGEEKLGRRTPPSVRDIASMETDKLLAEAKHGRRQRRQEALKCLVMNRDGLQCPVTGVRFRKPLSRDIDGFIPLLTHIIPNSVQGKPDTLKCLDMFAGEHASKLVLQHLDTVRNFMNLEANAHIRYDQAAWGIEACEEREKVKYICRGLIPRTRDDTVTFVLPVPIILKDGDEIHFGRGPEGERLEGPLPLLCNIQLAMARVLRMSGVANIISQIKEDADDSEFPQVYIASDVFCDILAAKLLLANGIPA